MNRTTMIVLCGLLLIGIGAWPEAHQFAQMPMPRLDIELPNGAPAWPEEQGRMVNPEDQPSQMYFWTKEPSRNFCNSQRVDLQVTTLGGKAGSIAAWVCVK